MSAADVPNIPDHAAVLIARQWLGTPYRHQAATLGAGCDCLGLLRGVWRSLYGQEPEAIPNYSPDWSEPQGQERLMAAALRHLQRQTGADASGDVLLFRMRAGSVAKHLGIAAQMGASPTFIHSYSGHGVVESPLTSAWGRRIAARFVFP